VVEQQHNVEPVEEKIVIYTRVSSHNKKEDLNRQLERCVAFCGAKGLPITKTYKEIASGMNDDRVQLWKMIDSNPTTIVVEHKDRLTRFGFNYLEKLLLKLNCKIIVINKDYEAENDIIKDMISIVTSFCCRLYGVRRGAKKVGLIKKVMEKTND
ncbi:MAG: IS607 family transposase, partial [Candidatus Riflemargulisbacteria bacterium]